MPACRTPCVLQVNDFPPDTVGGAEVVLANTCRLLQNAGWRVELFTAQDLGKTRRTPWRYVDNRVARQALARRLEECQPAVVHLHNFYHCLSPGILATLAAYRRRRPVRVLMTAHDCHLFCPDAGGTWFPGWRGVQRQPVSATHLRHWSYLFSRRWDRRGPVHSFLKLAQHIWNYRWQQRRQVLDVVICPSPFLARWCAPWVRAAVVLPNPVAAVPRGPRQRPGSLRLVFVGRLEPEKGLAEFLEIFPADFPATLTVLGEGTALDRCRRVCQRRGLVDRVHFLGRLEHRRVLELLGHFHVLVLPSLFLESYGMCVVEALAAGTNVLVSDRGALSELVAASGVGYVFTPGKAESLAAQLERIRQSHAAGTLNAFEVSAFLAERSEAAYLRGLLRLYAEGGGS